jgi:hypothetical protein
MDLSALNTTKTGDDGATLHLTHPATGVELYHDSDPITGERPIKPKEDGRPMTITGAGADSNAYRRIQSDMVRRQSGKRQKKMSPEEIEAAVTETLAAVVYSWTEIEKGGVALPFSKAGAIDLFGDFKWIREQWAEFINDRANFLKSA